MQIYPNYVNKFFILAAKQSRKLYIKSECILAKISFKISPK